MKDKTNFAVTILGLTSSTDDHFIWLYDEGIDKAIKLKNILYCANISVPKESTALTYFDENTKTTKHISS